MSNLVGGAWPGGVAGRHRVAAGGADGGRGGSALDVQFLRQRHFLPQTEHSGEAPGAGVVWPLVVRTAAEAAQRLGASRLARFAWTKLRSMGFPPEWRVRSSDINKLLYIR